MQLHEKKRRDVHQLCAIQQKMMWLDEEESAKIK